MEYAGRMLYMIQRRTIRDLIIRAQLHSNAATRKTAYFAILQNDEDIEKHFKDITANTESTFDVLVRFLATVQFLNGYEAMRWLSIGNRIKWMKICAMVWHLKGREIDAIRFDNGNKKTGLELDRRLRALDESRLNRYLVQIDAGILPDSFPDISLVNSKISAFGISFTIVGASTLEVDLI
jgi:hypothetical protein